MRWEARPEGLAARRYDIFAGGERLTVIHFPALGASTVEPLAGRAYRLRRAGVVRQRFWLEAAADGVVVAQAAPISLARRALRVSGGGWAGTLRPNGAFSSGFTLLVGGQPVGAIRASSAFRRGLEADLPDDLPPALGLFLLWVILFQRRRPRVTSATG